ncbi:HugZ family pyridoxamine 5'-phosphate oxidase [Trichormus variabilis]|uniref:Heme utilization protein HutZ n=1 Tax=Trichormus variabilis SAG 1403-4b TaxID=447716 RepID=A0A3S1CRI7_ANAVA|nr:pyridoxamine 5'-phosphate oxidase family protein [Trichormus variabilis]MBD2627749.1 pyridoxamine 5'-phosphate oxidase family protein [Trichormus variabilis FACHB-164]RUS97120.1 heme utilization protein HutZ [Trichormus variabilis SAG 1403-4b]
MSKIEKAQAEYEKFTEKFESIIISTVNEQGIPNASYTPFVIDDAKNIYIYVSGLSTHTKNIYANPHVSILFIEDEVNTKQIFARRRLTFDCTATLLERETDQWNQIVEQFQERFGEIIEMLRSLPDFRIFQLTPTEGRFVIGFGAAYYISGDNLNQLTLITE